MIKEDLLWRTNYKRSKTHYVFIKITRPDNTVYCTLTYDRGQKGYRFINLSHNHICQCVFKTIDDALKDLDKMKNEGSVLSYNVISQSFNINVILKHLFE